MQLFSFEKLHFLKRMNLNLCSISRKQMLNSLLSFYTRFTSLLCTQPKKDGK